MILARLHNGMLLVYIILKNLQRNAARRKIANSYVRTVGSSKPPNVFPFNSTTSPGPGGNRTQRFLMPAQRSTLAKGRTGSVGSKTHDALNRFCSWSALVP